jgi:hypothetical protein
MSDLTPLQRLDDAIHEFAAALGNEGAVSGWIVAYETTRITNEEGLVPLVHNTGYSVGPATSPAAATGLASALAELCRDEIVYSLRAEPDDNDE